MTNEFEDFEDLQMMWYGILIIFFFLLVVALFFVVLGYNNLKDACEDKGLKLAYNENGCVNSRGEFFNSYDTGLLFSDYVISDEPVLGVKVK